MLEAGFSYVVQAHQLMESKPWPGHVVPSSDVGGGLDLNLASQPKGVWRNMI